MVQRPALTVFTPWYPSVANPFLGSFVADWSRLAAHHRDVRVLHATEWPGGPTELVDKHLPEFRSLVRRMAGQGMLDAHGAFGTITRVPVPVVTGSTVGARATNACDAIRDALPHLDAPVMHGHVGYFGGLAAARMAPPETRVIVTEHSTELRNVLATEQGREIYAEVLERAHRLTCVSGLVRQQILDVLPQYAHRVQVVPNPVDLMAARRRARPPERLDKWVFIGGLIHRKGVVRLLEAFATFARSRPHASLDLFGDGELRGRLTDMARQRGVADRVVFHGATPHRVVLDALHRYDVLLAPSTYETFHLAVLEAIGAGLPVVVTRSGGPEEAVGESRRLCAEFIDVNDDPQELMEGVWGLEEALPRLDLDAARHELDARIGPDAVATTLADLYGEQRWGPGPATPTTPVRAPRQRPERVVVFAHRTWRSHALVPQITLARNDGLEVNVSGVHQPAEPIQLGLVGKVLRRVAVVARRKLTSRPRRAAGPTVALLGDMTAAGAVTRYWDRNPGIAAAVDLDPTLLGGPPVDAA